jgi:beta-mannosidase
MKAIDLNGTWLMKEAGGGDQLSSIVPGSVAATLLDHKRIVNPYDADNETKVLPVFDADYEFSRDFDVDASVLTCDRVRLHCDGLDTLAETTVNGKLVANTDNMHRTYVFDIKHLLQAGKNTITVLFRSPTQYLKTHPARTGKPFATIRKAACMFGWDWGLNLPDSGIWRDIYIETFNHARIDELNVRQVHHDGKVDLKVAVKTEAWTDENVDVLTDVLSPNGETIYSAKLPAKSGTMNFLVNIQNPQLWCPAGYGGQPLYEVRVRIEKGGTLLDEKRIRVGLRTVRLDRSRDGKGSKFEFVVNGRPIFFKGENLVIEDAVIRRSTQAHWDRLIDNCLKSNMNGIRIWGGAYYPPDYFFDLCDAHGILVSVDFMFASSFYEPKKEFVENVRQEVWDNVKRIRHHACLGLLCGNNELDMVFTVMTSTEKATSDLRKFFGGDKPVGPVVRMVVWNMYKKLFLDVIQKECKNLAPEISFEHSSPTTTRPGKAKSLFDYLSDGDMHYYLQYDMNAPYQKMRSFRSRFMSEMGFQSYPSIKTVRAFARAEDQTPYSKVMYSHQKCKNGNETIEEYMRRDYVVPTDFADYVYLSQLQAGEIMKYSIEHLRRDSGYCRGVIIWQLNDCWPVVSWAGIDYFGRWKAQQYFTKRFYAPILISAFDRGTTVGLWVTNDSVQDLDAKIIWRLCDNCSNILDSGEKVIASKSGSSAEFLTLDFADKVTDENRNKVYVEYELLADGNMLGSGTVLIALPKQFEFVKPSIALNFKETQDEYQIEVSSDCFVKGMALDLIDGDAIFSDNFFDLSQGRTKTVLVRKSDVTCVASLDDLKKQIVVTNLNEIILGR